jgi:hypothetical protein
MRFPKLALDLPDYTDGSPSHLVLAKNVYPASPAGNYKPFKGLSAATASIGAAWKGGGAFEYNGTSIMLGATAAKLRSHASGSWSDEHSVATTQPWYFIQFGDYVIGLNGGAPVNYQISAGTAANLSGSPPSASFGAIVKDFVMLAGNGSAAQTVYWSDINNAEVWSGGLSDSQVIPDGGPIKGIAGGEYGIVFQAEQYSLFEFTTDPRIVFTRRTIKGLGALTHGSIGQAGARVFFLSRRGFYMFLGGQEVPIGKDAVDQAFLSTYTISDIEASMRCTVDPDRSLVIWSMPDRLWIYNWDEQSWSFVDISGLVGIAAGLTASATLDDIAVIFPSIEDVTPVLDDAYWRGGDPLLLIFKTDFIGYTFSSGSNLEATFKFCKLEPVKGKTSHIHNSRPDTDAVSGVTVSIETSFRLGDAPTSVVSADLRDSGDVPIRATGQYVQPQVTLAAGTTWTHAQGLKLEGSPGGRL